MVRGAPGCVLGALCLCVGALGACDRPGRTVGWNPVADFSVVTPFGAMRTDAARRADVRRHSKAAKGMTRARSRGSPHEDP